MKRRWTSHIIAITALVVFIVLGLACATAPKVDFENFQNDPTYSQKFVGSWKFARPNGTYAVMVLNADGTGSETAFNKNDVSVSTLSIYYKVTAVQFIMQTVNPKRTVAWNYNFLDNDSFSLGSSLGSFLYRRTGPASSNNVNTATGIEGALARAAEQALQNVTPRSRIAIVYITAQDRSTTDYIAGELEYIWVNNGYIITDRSELDRLRREQNFQLSGEVDDATAVSIGRFAGADIIVTGRVDGEGNLRRLRLRVINTQSAQVVGVASERL